MMKATLAGAMATTVSAAGTLALTWSDCGDASTHAKVNDVEPATLTLGTSTDITGTGNVDEQVTGGSYDLELTAASIVHESFKGDVCSAKSFDIKVLGVKVGTISWKGLACPVAAGAATVGMSVELASALPPQLASSKVALTASSTSGDKLICLNLNLKKQMELEEMAAHINSLETTWKAETPTRFGNLDDVKMLLGTIMKGDERYVEALQEKEDDGFDVKDIPAEFDVRTAFPKCANVSGHIRDQSSCGSCWAFGSTEAFNDRRCIATGDTTLLSVEDTTANCGFLQCFSMGCNGGQPGQAWSWFTNKGVVTGGDYFDIGSGSTCAPYSLAPCAHHVPATAKYPACPSDEYSTPSLSKCSEDAYGTDYSSDKKKASNSYSLGSVAKIQADIVQYGSATGAFTVYSDFPTYKSGVYKHTSGDELGGHAIKIFGWGTENGEDYWLVANSWNEEWGDHGTFKIARGNNECGIEGQVSAGTVDNSVTV